MSSQKKASQSMESKESNKKQQLADEEKMLISKKLQKRQEQQQIGDEDQQTGKYKDRSSGVESEKKYVIKQHSNIKGDLQDFNDLEAEIERLKKIKNEYKEQKQSIEQLNKIVRSLKSQNKSLKLQKDSIRGQFEQKDQIKEIQRNFDTQQKKCRKFNNLQGQQNRLKGNIVNRQLTKKIFNIENVGVQRFLSPQGNRRISSNSLRNFGGIDSQQHYMNQMFKTDQQIMIRTHQHNKKSVIASFVEQLKCQLEQNELTLQRQKKSHRQTRQRLEVCLEEISQLRLVIDRRKNYDSLERENLQLRKQLQLEVQQRLLAEQKLREKEILLSQSQTGYALRSSDFDRELDKMDQIYLKMEKTLKL